MDETIYKVLERLAPPRGLEINFCRAESPNTPKHGFTTLICTLAKGHGGHHVAHMGWGSVSGEKIADIWEQE